LLSLKEDKEEPLDNSIKVIKKKFWSLGLSEIKKAFEMYALGDLNIKPISNHIDPILVGQIFNAYKNEIKTKPKKFNEDKFKAEQDYLYVTSAYDHFVSTDIIGDESVWIYDYLESTKKVVVFDQKQKKEIYERYYKKLPKLEAIKESKIELLRNCFQEFKDKGIHIKSYLE
jgi:hypothetical protein